MVDYTEKVQRLRVLWNRGRNIYTSFYTELDEARKEVGDDQFANWCFWELHISLDILNTTAGILKAADASVIKRDWAKARAAEKASKQAAAAEAERQRAGAAAQRAADRARKQRERETAKAEKQRRASENKDAEKRAAARHAARRRYAERKAAAAAAAAADSGGAGGNDGMSLDELALRIMLGKGKAERGRGAWVEGTMEAAVALADAKDRFPHTPAFGRWLTEKGIDYNHQDRAALINMGRVPELAEAALKVSSRTSYRYIWDEEIHPRVTQMGNSTAFEEFDESADPLGDNVVPLRGSAA